MRKKGWRCKKPGLGWYGGILIIALAMSAPAFAGIVAEHGHGQKSGMSHQPGVERPAWLNKLENQVDYEEVMSGLDGNQEQLNKTWMKLMGQLQNKIKEHADPASSGGGFHDSWAAHQLGQSFLLGPSEASA